MKKGKGKELEKFILYVWVNETNKKNCLTLINYEGINPTPPGPLHKTQKENLSLTEEGPRIPRVGSA